jgi:hypothetical protein
MKIYKQQWMDWTLELLHIDVRLKPVKAKNRTILADKERTYLAVTTGAKPALHISLEGNEYTFRWHTSCQGFKDDEADHNLGTTSQNDGITRVARVL